MEYDNKSILPLCVQMKHNGAQYKDRVTDSLYFLNTTIGIETRFEFALRVCLNEQLFSFLFPKFITILSMTKIYHCIDLYNLVSCNHNIKNIMIGKFVQIIEFPLSTLDYWEDESVNTPMKHVRKLLIDHDIVLNRRMLPRHVTHITFGNRYNQHLEINALHNTIKYLVFGHCYNKPLKPEVLPDVLTNLTFGRNFNQPLDPGVLSKTLICLVFGDNFNHPLKPGTFPDTLTDLKFGKKFNYPLTDEILPRGLTKLTFGDNFNQLFLEHTLPDTLTRLTFGKNYFQPLNRKVLPKQLTHLAFNTRCRMDQRSINPLTNGYLPDGLTYFILGTYTGIDLEYDLLPKKIIRLYVNGFWSNPNLDNSVK